MRTANPALNEKVFRDIYSESEGFNHMTIDGTVNKSFLLLIVLLFGASLVWFNIDSISNSGYFYGLFIVIIIATLILSIVTIFKPKVANITGPVYSFLEGLLLGFISVIAEMQFPGIVFQAVGLTFGTLFGLLFAYKSRLIKVTENFRLGVVAATGGIFLLYMMSFVLGFFGINVPFIHENGLIGIGFSLFVVVIAALNLVLDFDFIETAAEKKVPKYMEWYAAFGLMVTLIWLYIEILRLLIKLRSRD